MRKYTLLLSVTIHGVAALALIIAPLFAAATLPLVRDSVAYVPVSVTPPPPPPPPPAIAAAHPSHPSVAPAADVFPLKAPDSITPEPPAFAPVGRVNEGLGGAPNDIGGDPDGVPGGTPFAPPMPPTVRPPKPTEPLRVGGGIIAPRKTRDVAPVYPPIAVVARAEGIVVLEAVIAEDGSVRDVRVLRSVALLDQAAMDAVRQWHFTPTLLSGQPVPVVMTVTVNFKLN
jgi:protein TonB